MTFHAVIAARGGPDAKSRCRERLGEREREQLVEAMLGDMLEALAGSRLIDRIHVATPTASLARLAETWPGVSVIGEAPTRGLNGAFDAARRLIAADDPAAAVAFMPGDLPRLDRAELEMALADVREGRVGLVPAAADGGTGAVLLTAGAEFPFSFGLDSFRRHHAAAASVGLEAHDVVAPSLSLDIDAPEDLDKLLASGADGRTARLLRAIRGVRETCG